MSIAKQHHRIWRLKDQVDFILTDSPLLLSCIYSNDIQINRHSIYLFNQFNNLNIFIERNKKYVESGQMQTEEEARQLDEKTLTLLDDLNIDYFKFNPSDGIEFLAHKIINIKNNLTKEERYYFEK